MEGELRIDGKLVGRARNISIVIDDYLPPDLETAEKFWRSFNHDLCIEGKVVYDKGRKYVPSEIDHKTFFVVHKGEWLLLPNRGARRVFRRSIRGGRSKRIARKKEAQCAR